MTSSDNYKRCSLRLGILNTAAVLIIASVFVLFTAFCNGTIRAEDTVDGNTGGEFIDGSVTYTWQLEGEEAHITAITCEDERYELNIPEEIEGYPVTSIPWDECLTGNDRVTALSLPDGVTSVSDSAFGYTPNLQSVYVSDSNPGLTLQDGVLFNKDMTQLLVYPASKPGSDYVIPESVTSLKWNAFSYTQYLENLTLSSGITEFSDSIMFCDSLKSVDLNMLSRINGGQLTYCFNIERVTVSENNTKLVVYDNALYSYGNYWDYNDTEMTLSFYPPGRDDEVFTIPDEIDGRKVTCIMSAACRGSKFKEIGLPCNLVQIGGRAFEYCENLVTVVLPEGTEILGSNAFLCCNSLKYVYIPESVTDITDLTSGVPEGMTVYGIPGSTAEAYIENLYNPDTWPYDPDSGYTFKDIAEEKIPQDITLCNESVEEKITVLEDGTKQLKLDLNDGTADLSAYARRGVTYACDDPDVAEISEDGILTLKKEGETKLRITAVVAAGDEAYFAPTEMQIDLIVWDSQKPEPVEQTISGANKFTKTYGCAAFSLGQKAMTGLTYKSSNTKIAKVSSTGKVTIVAPGTVKITVTAAETDTYLKATKSVTVTSSVAKPTLKCKAGKRKVKVSWSKVAKAKGYQIYVKYPGKKKYKKVLTTSSKVKAVKHKKLRKGKKYSYKVRAYVKVGGKTYYSKFSKAKTVKVK